MKVDIISLLIYIAIIGWIGKVKAVYLIPEKNLTLIINVQPIPPDNRAEFNISYEFSSHDTELVTTTERYCMSHNITGIVCEEIFEQVIQVRYDYVEAEMIRLELAKNNTIINTQFIPNKHLLRSAHSMNTEINNNLKKTAAVVEFQMQLSPIIDEISRLLRLLLDETENEEVEEGTALIMRKNLAFIHSCSIDNEGNRILFDALAIIFRSELIHELSYLFIINYGIPVQRTVLDLIQYYPNIHLFHVSDDTSNFEVPTMKIMQESIQQLQTNQPFNLLYLHTKGVSYRQIYPQIEDWRHLMLYFLVERYRVCLSLLESGEYDSLGVNYKSNPRDYRGNFWWATSTYLAQLPSLDLQYTNKYTAEKWLHMGDRYRIYSFHESEVDHHRQLYPRDNYEVNENVAKVYPLIASRTGELGYSALCVGATVYWKQD